MSLPSSSSVTLRQLSCIYSLAVTIGIDLTSHTGMSPYDDRLIFCALVLICAMSVRGIFSANSRCVSLETLCIAAVTAIDKSRRTRPKRGVCDKMFELIGYVAMPYLCGSVNNTVVLIRLISVRPVFRISQLTRLALIEAETCSCQEARV